MRVAAGAIWRRFGRFISGCLPIAACLAGNGALAAEFAIDADSGAALPQTWMVATRTVCQGFGHCSSSCVEVRAEVDRNVLPFWRPDTDYAWQFYRGGYYAVEITPGRPKLSRRRPTNWMPGWDDASARIAYITQLGRQAACAQAGLEERRRQVPFFLEMIGEGFSLATLPEQQQSVQNLCRELVDIAGRDPAPPACFEKLDWGERDALLNAAHQGNLGALNQLLPATMTAAFRARRLAPALAMAASAGQVAAMRLLLDHHADPGPAFERVLQQIAGGPAPSGEFELRTASVVRRVTSSRNSPPAGPAEPQMTPVERARVAAEILLAAGADSRRGDPQGHAPLHRMAIAGDAQMIALLLRYGAPIDQPAAACQSCISDGETPLMDAANAAIAEQLIAAGANVDAKDRKGWPALVLTNKAEVALVLVDHGANVNATYANDWTPLMDWLRSYESYRSNPAMARPYADVARRLVAAGASLAARNADGTAVLDCTSDAQFKAELLDIAARAKARAH